MESGRPPQVAAPHMFYICSPISLFNVCPAVDIYFSQTSRLSLKLSFNTKILYINKYTLYRISSLLLLCIII